MEGCFSTSLCPADQRVGCALNLLRLGAKDWWRLTTRSFSDAQRAAVSWDQFRGMFSTRYVPRDEKERLAREFLELKQDLESVTEITRMFIGRAMFRPEFAPEQAQMPDIRVSSRGYQTVRVCAEVRDPVGVAEGRHVA